MKTTYYTEYRVNGSRKETMVDSTSVAGAKRKIRSIYGAGVTIKFIYIAANSKIYL